MLPIPILASNCFQCLAASAHPLLCSTVLFGGAQTSQTASPWRAAAAAQLPAWISLLIPGCQFELLFSDNHIVLCPLNIGLDVLNGSPLFFHQHEDVQEEVSEFLHVVLQAYQLLSSYTNHCGQTLYVCHTGILAKTLLINAKWPVLVV